MCTNQKSTHKRIEFCSVELNEALWGDESWAPSDRKGVRPDDKYSISKRSKHHIKVLNTRGRSIIRQKLCLRTDTSKQTNAIQNGWRLYQVSILLMQNIHKNFTVHLLWSTFPYGMDFKVIKSHKMSENVFTFIIFIAAIISIFCFLHIRFGEME